MRQDTTIAQKSHRVLSMAALVGVAITLFLVGIAAFRDPQPPATAKPTPSQQALGVRATAPTASDRLHQLEAVEDEGDTAVSRLLAAGLLILALAVGMLGLAAFGRAPPALLRLTTRLAALSALSAVLVLTRDVAVVLAALQVPTVTAMLAVAARIVGRHSLLDSPWRGVRTAAVWPEAGTREARIGG
jgi:hypothetical protein